MRFIACCLIFFLSVSGLRAQDTINRTDSLGKRQGYWIISAGMRHDNRYSADEPVEEGKYLNGLKEGDWKEYYPGGIPKSIIHFRHNRPEGNYLLFYASGQVQESGTKQKNAQNSSETYFDHPGAVMSRDSFSENGARTYHADFFYDSLWHPCMLLESNRIRDDEGWRAVYYNSKGQIEKTASGFGDYPAIPKAVRYGSLKLPDLIDSSTSRFRETAGTSWEGTRSNCVFDGPGTTQSQTLYDIKGRVKMKGYFEKNRLKDGEEYLYDENGRHFATRWYSGFKMIREEKTDN